MTYSLYTRSRPTRPRKGSGSCLATTDLRTSRLLMCTLYTCSKHVFHMESFLPLDSKIFFAIRRKDF